MRDVVNDEGLGQRDVTNFTKAEFRRWDRALAKSRAEPNEMAPVRHLSKQKIREQYPPERVQQLIRMAGIGRKTRR